jgi:hypothetical protein
MVQNPWKVGWVVISKYFAAEVIQFCLQVIQAGNYADEEVKPDWSIFPARMGRDLTMVCCQFSLALCTCMHDHMIHRLTFVPDLCSPGDFAQLYSCPKARRTRAHLSRVLVIRDKLDRQNFLVCGQHLWNFRHSWHVNQISNMFDIFRHSWQKILVCGEQTTSAPK